MASSLLLELQYLLAGVIVLILPGTAWQAWFPSEKDAGQRLAEAFALSVAFTSLVALLAFIVGFRFTSFYLIALYFILFILVILGRVYQRRRIRFDLGLPFALLALIIFILWRLYQARGLVLPAWVDSVHHVLIIRAFLEQGGLPTDLNPLLPVPFYYHFGFHALAAVFSFWSRMSPEQAVLSFGQVINAAVGLSVYALGMTIWKDVKRAGAAAVLVIFAFQMPAYYLTWGRYPLLTGLIVLPLTISAALEISRQPRPGKELIARFALLTGGLFLAHYLTAILLALFLIVLGIQRLWLDIRSRKIGWPVWAGLFLGVGVGLVFAGPWLLRIWNFSSQSFRIDTVLTADAPDQQYFSGYKDYLIFLSGPWRNHFLLIISGIGALFAFRKPEGRPLAAWGLLVTAFAIPWGLRLGPFRPDHMVIVLFLPASLLVANLLFSGGEAAALVFKQRVTWPLAGLALLALLAWGIRDTRNIVNPGTIITDADDMRAIRWIQGNTESNARFLINITPWMGSIYRGVDGGWWLLPITGRQTVLPPVVYTWGNQPYVQETTDFARRAGSLTACDSGFWTLIVDAHLDYAYLRDDKGNLKPKTLEGCPDVKTIYQDGHVWVFKVR